MTDNENQTEAYDGSSVYVHDIENILDERVLPRKLPFLYGPDSWLVGLTSEEPFVLDNPSSQEIRQNIAVSFRLVPVFSQTAEQKAYTDSIAAQAATNSIGGLRKHAESPKFLNEKRTAFVSTALDLAIYVYLVDDTELAEGQEEGDNDKEIFYGTALRIPVNLLGWEDRHATAVNEDDREMDAALTMLETMFTLRQNSFTQALINGVQAHADVTSRIAEISAANYLDEDVSAANAAAPMDADAIFAAQQKEAVDKIRVVYSGATKAPSKLKNVVIKAEGIADLVYKFNRLSDVLDGVTSSEVVDATLQMLTRVTHFVEPSDNLTIGA